MGAVDELIIDGGPLGIQPLAQAARGRVRVTLSARAQAQLVASRQALEEALARGEILYGVNTGFGSLAQERIEGEQLREVQRNLILSHAAGVGEPLPPDVVRAM